MKRCFRLDVKSRTGTCTQQRRGRGSAGPRTSNQERAGGTAGSGWKSEQLLSVRLLWPQNHSHAKILIKRLKRKKSLPVRSQPPSSVLTARVARHGVWSLKSRLHLPGRIRTGTRGGRLAAATPLMALDHGTSSASCPLRPPGAAGAARCSVGSWPAPAAPQPWRASPPPRSVTSLPELHCALEITHTSELRVKQQRARFKKTQGRAGSEGCETHTSHRGFSD